MINITTGDGSPQAIASAWEFPEVIKSMTGFGRCEIAKGERKITVEMKSVNHRYLDVSIKMPKKLNFLDRKSVV